MKIRTLIIDAMALAGIFAMPYAILYMGTL